MTDMLDAAIAAADAETRLGGALTLSTGRVVKVDVPVGLTAAEMLELLVNLPGGIAQLYAGYTARPAGRIALPNGALHVVGRAADG